MMKKLLMLMMLSQASWSAVALNNVGTPDRQAGGVYTGNFSVTAGGSNIVAFAALTWNGDNQTGTAVVTYGGNTMTSCGTKSTAGTSGGAGSQWFYLVNPPTGSNSLVATITSVPTATEIYANVISFTGVDQATPVRTGSYNFTVSSSAAGTTFTNTIQSNASDRTVTAISDDTGISGTNQTQQWSNTTGVMEQYGDMGTTPASAITHTWTFASGGANFVYAGFSVAAAAGGGGGSPQAQRRVIISGQ